MIEIDYGAQPPIDGYGAGGFRIGGAWRVGSILIMPEGLHAIDGLDVADLEPLLAAASAPDVVLMGQGADVAPLSPALREALERADIGYEIMSTASACRTYNVLLTEDRRVAAALLAVGQAPGGRRP